MSIKRIVSFTIALLMFVSCILVLGTEEAFRIFPSVISGEIIRTTGTLSFVFDTEMNESTLNPSTVLLKEEIKTDGGYNNRQYKFEYKAEEKRFSIHFSEGDIAPMTEYIVEFTTSVKTADGKSLQSPKSFRYTTTFDGYYLNDNFSRYKVGTALGINNASVTSLLPWQYVYQEYGTLHTQKIVEKDGKNVFALKAGNSAQNSFYLLGARGNCLPNVTYHDYSLTELEFDFSGGEDSAILLWTDLYTIRKYNGEFYLWFRTTSRGSSYSSAYNPDYMIPVCPIAPGVKHNIRILTYVSGTKRICVGLWLDGNLISQYVDKANSVEGETIVMKDIPSTGFVLTAYNDIDRAIAKPIYYNNSTKVNPLFLVGAAKGQETELNLYSVKYLPYTPVRNIDVGGALNMVKPNTDIRVKFNIEPDISYLNDSYITIVDNDGNFIGWHGEYDNASMTLTITPDTYLDSNKQYTVNVSEEIQYSFEVSGETSKTFTFTTGYERLEVTGITKSLASGNNEIKVSVKNNAVLSETFQTKTVLYQRNGSIVNMLSQITNTHNVAAGSTSVIATGNVTVPASTDCFVKVFFLSNDEVIADAWVLGKDASVIPNGIPGGVDGLQIETMADNAFVRVEGKKAGNAGKPAFITIENPSGGVSYIDQVTCGENGEYAIAFNLPSGSENGRYNCIVHFCGGDVTGAFFDMDFSQVKPVASGLEIVGKRVCGRELTARYQYFHFMGKESDDIITWLMSDTKDGTYSVIGNGKTLLLTENHLRKYVKFTVLARTVDGIEAEEVKESEPVLITAEPVIKNLQLHQEGNKVVVTYDYSHLLDYEEHQSIYEWYIAPSSGGNYVKIENNASFYMITNSDSGKYVKVTVTPRAKTPTIDEDERTGETKSTSPWCMTYTQPKSASSGGKGGGGSAGGGGVKSSPAVEYKIEPVEVDKSGEVDFLDVRGHWAENYIYNLYDQKIVNGKSENIFEPDSSITRAEFVAILVRALRFDLVQYDNEFLDVSKNDWYANAIKTAYVNGILLGDSGYAYPNALITRQEMAALAVRSVCPCFSNKSP